VAPLADVSLGRCESRPDGVLPQVGTEVPLTEFSRRRCPNRHASSLNSRSHVNEEIASLTRQAPSINEHLFRGLHAARQIIEALADRLQPPPPAYPPSRPGHPDKRVQL
jgi:hypothetical protein